jgi:hypothetical protein
MAQWGYEPYGRGPAYWEIDDRPVLIGESPGNLWLYTIGMEWLWTGQGIYPWLWRGRDQAWLYYFRDTKPRAFWNVSAGALEWRE